MNPTHFRLALLALTGLSVVLSISVLGTAAHTLSVYKSQHSTNPWWLPLWSEHFDTHGTSGLIAAAVLVLILNSVYIGLSFLPKLNLANRPHLRAFISIATTLPGALLTLATIILAHVLNHQSPDIDTIQTWTCRYGENPPTTVGVDLPAGQSNKQFSALCTESKYALYTTLVVFLLQAIMIGLTLFTWVVELWNNTKPKKEEWKDASSIEMQGGNN